MEIGKDAKFLDVINKPIKKAFSKTMFVISEYLDVRLNYSRWLFFEYIDECYEILIKITRKQTVPVTFFNNEIWR